MSHTSKYSVKIKDVDLLCKIAMELGHKVNFVNTLQEQTVKLFGSNSIQAVASILIDGWRLPIAINKDGEIFYDHFGSAPNTMEKLGKLLQKYSVELIISSLPINKIKNYYDEKIEETGEVKITIEYN